MLETASDKVSTFCQTQKIMMAYNCVKPQISGTT